jgi:hypothetical protein
MKNLVLSLFVLLVGAFCQAQDSVDVRFYVKGSDVFYVKLNGELQSVQNILRVKKGVYDVEIWSPKHLTYTGKLEANGDKIISYVAKLEGDPKFLDYLIEKEEYKKKVLGMRTIPALIGGLGLVTTPIFATRTKTSHEDYVINNFRTDFGAASTKTNEDLKRQYLTNRNLLFSSLGLFAIGTGSFFLLRKKVKDLHTPLYRQKNPFTLEFFEMSYNDQLSAPQFGFQFNF